MPRCFDDGAIHRIDAVHRHATLHKHGRRAAAERFAARTGVRREALTDWAGVA
jgi:hypothetical protein